jgi:hypothetical protein
MLKALKDTWEQIESLRVVGSHAADSLQEYSVQCGASHSLPPAHTNTPSFQEDTPQKA